MPTVDLVFRDLPEIFEWFECIKTRCWVLNVCRFHFLISRNVSIDLSKNNTFYFTNVEYCMADVGNSISSSIGKNIRFDSLDEAKQAIETWIRDREYKE